MTDATGSESRPPLDERIECGLSPSFADFMRQLGGSLIVSTYQAGKVVLFGWDGEHVSVLPRNFDKPLGIAVDGPRVALATRNDVHFFANAPWLAPDYLENQRGRYDSLYLPRASFHTADLHIHDLAFGEGGIWFVNTRFSCIARLSIEQSFLPAWKPSFISELAPEDRCHLNGLAMESGRPRYVTALGESDRVGGWRENKATGGIVIDVASGSIIVRGLSMPHSPRLYDGALWLLDSGTGRLLRVDRQTHAVAVVRELPGYLRGLCFVGPFAIIGMCQIREKHLFGGLPIQGKHERLICGIAVVDLRSGAQVAQFEFTRGAQELYDIQFLPGTRMSMIVNLQMEQARQAVSTPEFAYWLRPSNLIPEDRPSP